MKLSYRLLTGFLLFTIQTLITQGQAIPQKQGLAHAAYLSLNGTILNSGNPVTTDGNIEVVNAPLLRLIRTKASHIKGTLLLLPGGSYQVLHLKNEGKKASAFFNAEGFDVAILDYHINAGAQTKNLALTDALKAFRLLKAKHSVFGLRGPRLDMAGFTSGGNLTARTIQRLNESEQPDNVFLISPTGMDETFSGTVLSAILPPIQPAAKLFTTISLKEDKTSVIACMEYTKKWIGYDGNAIFAPLPDSAYASGNDQNPLDTRFKLAGILHSFLTTETVVIKNSMVNPAAVPVAGYSPQRHREKLAQVANHQYDLIMIGNSITNNFEKPEYQGVWNQFFAPRNALNLGFSGYRTENLIWNIQNGELEGQSPKVVILEIGTNNIDEKNYPTRHTADQLAGGIETIVKLLRQKLTNTKIIIMRCFPGCYGGPNPTSHRAILERASDIVSKLADGKNIFYCDVNHVFLNMDGSINHQELQDWLHPSPAGARAWAQAMEPLLSQLMGDKSLDTDVPANTAIVPVTKLEADSYDWFDRHAEVVRIKDSVNPEIILIGNSITHFWGGNYPQLKYTDGKLRSPNGPKAWASVFAPYRVLNLGFGWDRTQNVLWRLDHGEIDGLHPQTVIIDIGTNNTSQTDSARINTATEIVEGIRAVFMRVRSKLPGAKIVLMAIFPREKDPMSSRRILINDVNRQLKVFAQENKINLVDIGPSLLNPDGTFLPGMMIDFTHPTDQGYQVWANAIRPFITQP